MNNINEIKNCLINYGMNEKEIAVYLCVLSLGDATINQIAKTTKIKRTTVYLITERLANKSVLGEYKVRYGTHYVATSPRQLLERLDNIRTQFYSILPRLEAVEKKDLEHPSVKFFRGKDGYLSILNDSLAGFSYEILYLGSASELNQIVSEEFVTVKYIPERVKRRLKFRQLVFPDPFSKELQIDDDKELRKTKFLPANTDFKANMLIYLDKVAYFSSRKELSCLLVESKDISEMEREKFDLMWNNLS